MGAILNLLENYLDKDLEQMKTISNSSVGQKSPDWASDGSVEDVIIKVLKLFIFKFNIIRLVLFLS